MVVVAAMWHQQVVSPGGRCTNIGPVLRRTGLVGPLVQRAPGPIAYRIYLAKIYTGYLAPIVLFRTKFKVLAGTLGTDSVTPGSARGRVLGFIYRSMGEPANHGAPHQHVVRLASGSLT